MSTVDWCRAASLARAAHASAEHLELGDQDLLPNLGIMAIHVGDAAAVREYHQLLLIRARSTSAVLTVLYALQSLPLGATPV